MSHNLQILVRADGEDGFQIVDFVICHTCFALVCATDMDQHDDWHRTVLRRLP